MRLLESELRAADRLDPPECRMGRRSEDEQPGGAGMSFETVEAVSDRRVNPLRVAEKLDIA
jgi:hypothetical protein